MDSVYEFPHTRLDFIFFLTIQPLKHNTVHNMDDGGRKVGQGKKFREIEFHVFFLGGGSDISKWFFLVVVGYLSCIKAAAVVYFFIHIRIIFLYHHIIDHGAKLCVF